MNIYMICTLWTPFQAERDWKNSYREILLIPLYIFYSLCFAYISYLCLFIYLCIEHIYMKISVAIINVPSIYWWDFNDDSNYKITFINEINEICTKCILIIYISYHIYIYMKISWEHRYIYYLYGLNWELLCIFILHYLLRKVSKCKQSECQF